VTTTHPATESGCRFGPNELDAVLQTRPEVRYDYFVKRVADGKGVWGLRNAEGWDDARAAPHAAAPQR